MIVDINTFLGVLHYNLTYIQHPSHVDKPLAPLTFAMGSRVRFVDPSENQIYLYSPASPTLSTLSSSPGPVTPSSPHTSLSSSSSVTEARSFHEALRLNPRLPFRFDLSVDPRTLPLGSSEYFSLIQDEDATIPPTVYLELWCRRLPWVIEITPATGQHVTVSDVLFGLYDALQARMTDEEYQLSTDPQKFPGVRDDVDRAFKARCDKLMEHNVGSAEEERKKGRRLIDLLRGHNVFYGLLLDPNTGVARFSVQST
ncbi:hypothetical protein VKT23_016517 [Stygiomarasmius scandens]|uniref:DUF6699 domain-containing protein n=1 Tax=Marasmiellus scandens TaxID=2682957 RepID=A0ABR1IXK8_9AGAR